MKINYEVKELTKSEKNANKKKKNAVAKSTTTTTIVTESIANSQYTYLHIYTQIHRDKMR